MIGTKPYGLWYSDGMAWIEWCLREEFRLHAVVFHNLYSITLKKEANIIRIGTKKDLVAFVDNYKYIPPTFHLITGIYWDKVQGDGYHGVEFSPYWQLDWPLLKKVGIWYSGIDVPSGCVWDMNMVKTIKKVDRNEESGNPRPTGLIQAIASEECC